MKTYKKPVVEIEKFTVADVITLSNEEATTSKPTDNGVDDSWANNSVGIEINDEF